MQPDGLTRHSRVGVLGAALSHMTTDSYVHVPPPCAGVGALPAPRTSPLLAVRGIASGLPGALDEVGGRNAHSHVNTRDDQFCPSRAVGALLACTPYVCGLLAAWLTSRSTNHGQTARSAGSVPSWV